MMVLLLQALDVWISCFLIDNVADGVLQFSRKATKSVRRTLHGKAVLHFVRT